MPLALIILIVVIVLVAIWFVVIYNGIVTADNKCENAWQTIDAQLQRRNDLIPNLVETVKGYAAHESGTLEAVTAARSAVAGATTPEAKMEASNMWAVVALRRRPSERRMLSTSSMNRSYCITWNFSSVKCRIESTVVSWFLRIASLCRRSSPQWVDSAS